MSRPLGSKNRKSYMFGAVDNMANEALSPEASVETLKLTENPKDITDGVIVEGFTIKVKDDDDKVIYEQANQPFSWTKVSSLAAVLASEGATLSDDQIAFLGEALKDVEGETKNGEAVKALIDTYNSTQRSNAKQNEYARVMNLKKPLVGEKLENAVESMVSNFARINKVTLEAARKTLKDAGIIQ